MSPVSTPEFPFWLLLCVEQFRNVVIFEPFYPGPGHESVPRLPGTVVGRRVLLPHSPCGSLAFMWSRAVMVRSRWSEFGYPVGFVCRENWEFDNIPLRYRLSVPVDPLPVGAGRPPPHPQRPGCNVIMVPGATILRKKIKFSIFKILIFFKDDPRWDHPKIPGMISLNRSLNPPKSRKTYYNLPKESYTF